MAQSAAILFVFANAAFFAFGQADLGGPLASEEEAGTVLLQTQALKEVESASHTEEAADVSVEDEESKVLEGMDKPEEPSKPEPRHDDPIVHDLSDHDIDHTNDDGLTEEERAHVAEIQAQDAGALPRCNQTHSLIDSSSMKDEFGDAIGEQIAPEDMGESSEVFNDPGDQSYTEDSREADMEDLVKQVSFGDDGAEGFQDLNNVNGTASELQVHGGLKPETGDKVPKWAQSFPGCGCDFQEFSKTWTCKGTIAAPKSVSGKECCCCTMSCDRRNRCDHDTCDAIGIDQRAEVEAYEAARKKRLGDADAIFCDTKMYSVAVGPGRASNSKNLAACRKIGKWPLCDHSSYAGRGKQCYFPRQKKPCEGRHFSHIAHLRADGFDIMEFYGKCFTANNGDHCLSPHAEAHAWNNHGGNYNINNPGTPNKVVQLIPVADFDNQRAMGGWHTFCVNESPN